eukprot:749042-Hanusia_phi.AAC.1
MAAGGRGCGCTPRKTTRQSDLPLHRISFSRMNFSDSTPRLQRKVFFIAATKLYPRRDSRAHP